MIITATYFFHSHPFCTQHITESNKYGLVLFHRGEEFTFFSPHWPLHYNGAFPTDLTFPNTKAQHTWTRSIDMFYIIVEHLEHRQNTKMIFMGCPWLVWWQKVRDFPQCWSFQRKKINIGPFHQDPQQLFQSHYNKEHVVINCMNIPEYTLRPIG